MLIDVLSVTPVTVHTKGINLASVSLIVGIISTVITLMGFLIRASVKSMGRYVHGEVEQVTKVLENNLNRVDLRQKIMLTGGIAVLLIGLAERLMGIAAGRRR